jgi:hypothetical protein
MLAKPSSTNAINASLGLKLPKYSRQTLGRNPAFFRIKCGFYGTVRNFSDSSAGELETRQSVGNLKNSACYWLFCKPWLQVGKRAQLAIAVSEQLGFEFLAQARNSGV